MFTSSGYRDTDGGAVSNPAPSDETDDHQNVIVKMEDRIQELKDFCPIGRSFNYLGIEFVVLDHAKRNSMVSPTHGERTVTMCAALITHYHNRVTGTIQQRVFTDFELDGIVGSVKFYGS